MPGGRRLVGRRAVLLGGGTALAGCGFRPLYAPTDSGAPGPASAEMSAIYVPIFADRPGQLLRQALQQRFEGTGTGTAKRYELVASIAVSTDAIAIQRDTSSSRVRLIGSAPWVLRTLSLERTVLAQGTSRILDGYNILNQQFFAADLESETAIRRVASALADQITVQVGAFFLRRAKTA
jgi:LPS-assembly lipoprotein